MSKRAPTRLLVAGYYGFTNVGDEAVLAAMVQDIRSAIPAVELVVTSEEPERTRLAHDVLAVNWREMRSVIEAIRGSDAVVLGGGGLINSYLTYQPDALLSPGHSLFDSFVFGVPVLAWFMERPCVLFGVGATRIESAAARSHAAFAVNLTAARTVRDAGSKSVLADLGVNPDTIEITADPAFRLVDASRARVDDLLSAQRLDLGAPTMAVVVRNWIVSGAPDARDRALASAIAAFARERRLQVLFIPFDHYLPTAEHSRDLGAIQRIQNLIGAEPRTQVLEGVLAPELVAGVMSRCAIVLAMRLHALVLGAKNAVPFVAISYDPKVRSIAHDMGMDGCVLDDGPTLTADAIIERLRDTMAHRDYFRQRLSGVAQEFARRAIRNTQTLLDVLAQTPTRHGAISVDVTTLRSIAGKQTRALADLYERHHEAVAHGRGVRDLVDSGRYADAYKELEVLLAAAPDHAEWNYLAAFCLHQLGRSPEVALVRYERALNAGFDPFWVFFNRGALRSKLGNSREAMEDALKASVLRADHPGPRQLLKELGAAPSPDTV